LASVNTLTIEDATECLIDYRGKTPPKTDSGIRLVTAKVVKAGQIQSEPAEFIAADFYDEWMRRGLPEKFDVLLTTEAPLGEVAILKNEDRIALAQRIILLRAKPGLVNPHYLFYALQSDFGQAELKARASGTTVLGIKQSELRKVRVPVFSLEVQERIATILSAYDDLIENGQRRIKILESMARVLYREWFVNFRFPGYEKHQRVASALGEIPRGWEALPFTEIADVLSGGTPKTDIEEYWDGDIPFFTPRDAPGGFYVQDAEKHVTKMGLETCASELYPVDTVFITARGTVGKVALPSVPMAMNQSCYALRGKSGIPQRFLFLMTLQQVDYLKTNTGGATFSTIVIDTFRRMEVVVPPRATIAGFVRRVDGIFDQLKTLERQVSNLRHTRDLLLPHLLSGRLLPINLDRAA
jgi:type I restriction enzyme S subunit